MSYILDALRRAESGPTPTATAAAPIIADTVPAAPGDLRQRLGRLGAALALIALGAAGTWWWAREPAPRPAAAVSAPVSAPVAASVATARPTSPLRSQAEAAAPRRAPVRALDREAARAPAPPTPTRALPERTRSGSASSLPPPGRKGSVTIVPAPGRDDRPAPSPSRNTAADSETAAHLPRYENLLSAGRINLPNLNMDIHAYNRSPSKRFVFINLRKYREGDTLDARTRVEEITATGAVINHDGQRFLMRPN